MFQIGFKKILWLKKVINIVTWAYKISALNDETIVGTFYEKQMQIANHTRLKIETVIMRKGGNLYIKYIVYNNSSNNWSNGKDIII